MSSQFLKLQFAVPFSLAILNMYIYRFDEMDNIELDAEALDQVAGGGAKARLFGCSGVY